MSDSKQLGGYLVGNSHANGGIKIKTPEGKIEAEGGEVIINRRALSLEDEYVCTGTPKEITSKVNEMEGGVSWSETGSCRLVKKAADGTEIDGEDIYRASEGVAVQYIKNGKLSIITADTVDQAELIYQAIDDYREGFISKEEMENTLQSYMGDEYMLDESKVEVIGGVKHLHSDYYDGWIPFYNDEPINADESTAIAALGRELYGDKSRDIIGKNIGQTETGITISETKEKINKLVTEWEDIRKEYRSGLITDNEYIQEKSDLLEKYHPYIQKAKEYNISVSPGILYIPKKRADGGSVQTIARDFEPESAERYRITSSDPNIASWTGTVPEIIEFIESCKDSIENYSSFDSWDVNLEKMRLNYSPVDMEFAAKGTIIRSTDASKRPSPSVSATIYPVGYRLEGNDGNMWEIAADSRGVHRWKRVSTVTAAANGISFDKKDGKITILELQDSSESNKLQQWSWYPGGYPGTPFAVDFDLEFEYTEEESDRISGGWEYPEWETTRESALYPSGISNIRFYDENGDDVNVDETTRKDYEEKLDKVVKQYLFSETFDDNHSISVNPEQVPFGVMPNNYERKSPEQVWNMWTMLQKRHFIQDHIHSGDVTAPQEVKYNDWKFYSNVDYDKLHPYIQDELQRHLWQGQYKNGGGVGRSKAAIAKDRKYFNKNEKHEVAYANRTGRYTQAYNKGLGMFAKDGMAARGKIIVTSIKDIPNLEEEINAGRVTYRGLGMGKLYDDFYEIANEPGTRIKVKGKEYYITDKDFRKLDWDDKNKKWRNRIRFSAPARQYAMGGGVSSCGCSHAEDGMSIAEIDKELEEIAEKKEKLKNELLDVSMGIRPRSDKAKIEAKFAPLNNRANELLKKKYSKAEDGTEITPTYEDWLAENESFLMDKYNEYVSNAEIEGVPQDYILSFDGWSMDMYEDVYDIYRKGGDIGRTYVNEDGVKYYAGKDERGIWTVYSEGTKAPYIWGKRNEFPSGLASKEDAVHLAKVSAGVEQEEDPERYYMEHEYAKGGMTNMAADGKNLKKGEMWFSPTGEISIEPKGTALHMIERKLAKMLGAEDMERIGSDEINYIYVLKGNPMMIAAKTGILEEEGKLDIETWGSQKRVRIPKAVMDNEIYVRYPLITPFADGGPTKVDDESRGIMNEIVNKLTNNGKLYLSILELQDEAKKRGIPEEKINLYINLRLYSGVNELNYADYGTDNRIYPDTGLTAKQELNQVQRWLRTSGWAEAGSFDDWDWDGEVLVLFDEDGEVIERYSREELIQSGVFISKRKRYAGGGNIPQWAMEAGFSQDDYDFMINVENREAESDYLWLYVGKYSDLNEADFEASKITEYETDIIERNGEYWLFFKINFPYSNIERVAAADGKELGYKGINKDVVARIMHEFKEGDLRDSHGSLVTDRKQAIAIALSMGRRKK